MSALLRLPVRHSELVETLIGIIDRRRKGLVHHERHREVAAAVAELVWPLNPGLSLSEIEAIERRNIGAIDYPASIANEIAELVLCAPIRIPPGELFEHLPVIEIPAQSPMASLGEIVASDLTMRWTGNFAAQMSSEDLGLSFEFRTGSVEIGSGGTLAVVAMANRLFISGYGPDWDMGDAAEAAQRLIQIATAMNCIRLRWACGRDSLTLRAQGKLLACA